MSSGICPEECYHLVPTQTQDVLRESLLSWGGVLDRRSHALYRSEKTGRDAVSVRAVRPGHRHLRAAHLLEERVVLAGVGAEEDDRGRPTGLGRASAFLRVDAEGRLRAPG